MLKQIKQAFRASPLENGVDLTTKEIKELPLGLTQRLQTLEEEILKAINLNNYTLLYNLVNERKRIPNAIDAIEKILNQKYEGHFFASVTIEKLSSKMDDLLSSINNTSINITSYVINQVAKGLAYSSQLSGKMQHSLK